MSAHRLATACAAAVLVLAGAVAAPAHATETETEAGPQTSSFACPLERVGEHFVRCDTFTGDGQPAPAFIPEWTSDSLR